MFVDAYGAEAGNLALRAVATGGVFVGGGIAPKILPALTDGRFMRAFRDKAPFDRMLARMPVKVILNAEAGLLGAAVYAAARAEISVLTSLSHSAGHEFTSTGSLRSDQAGGSGSAVIRDSCCGFAAA